MRFSLPRLTFLHLLFDICYLALLCAVILVTFFHVFLPAQPAMMALYGQSVPIFQHAVNTALPTNPIIFCAIGSLVYLKCIWRLICR